MTWNIEKIVDAAGGRKPIAKHYDLTEDAVRKWLQIGIPDRYWPGLIKLSKKAYGPNELYRANRAVRERKAA